jgi:hypothetical protein
MSLITTIHHSTVAEFLGTHQVEVPFCSLGVSALILRIIDEEVCGLALVQVQRLHHVRSI